MAKQFHPKGSVIAALDVGSTKIACFIARIRDDNGNIDLIGIGHQASQGIKSGTVVDLDSAEAAIRQAVHAAENMAHIRGLVPVKAAYGLLDENLRSDPLLFPLQIDRDKMELIEDVEEDIVHYYKAWDHAKCG